jgi:hypothetical protein
MTDKQKQAIMILNNLHQQLSINDDEYFLLLDFIIGHKEPIITLPSNHNWWEDVVKKPYDVPITVMYGCPVPPSFSDSASIDNSNKA